MFTPSVGGASGNPPIGNSLRFRSAASGYLQRTFGTPTDGKKWTMSLWVKRGALSSQMSLFGASSGTDTGLILESSDVVSFAYGGSWRRIGTKKERDPSAASHIQIVFDSANATEADRLIYYFNNTRITWPVSVAVALNDTTAWNSNGVVGYIGKNLAGLSAGYLDGYLSRICFVDGSALTPSSFGTTDTVTGQWVSKSASACKAVVDAGGTNSFMLDFNNGSSTTTLGNDYSAKGNNWTTSGISLTAGSTYDWMLDVPSGNGPNYATLNSATPKYSGDSLSNANLTWTSVAASTGGPVSTIAMSSGKWWVEVSPTGTYATNHLIGIYPATSALPTYLFGATGGYGWYGGTGQKYVNGTASTYGSNTTFASGDVIGIALDLDSNQVTFYKQTGGTGSFVANAGGAISITSGLAWYFTCTSGASQTLVSDWNFGQRPSSNSASIPTGYKSLCTSNLGTPAIKKPNLHFDVAKYNGTGSSQTISVDGNGNSLVVAPDLVWVKGRNVAASHCLYDVIRGVTKHLGSNLTNAEITESAGAGLTSFNSNGFSVGTEVTSFGEVNTATSTYAAWLWKAGGAAVTNNAGSISSQVSANTNAGFSIVKFAKANATIETVGHGLGVAPAMIIKKDINDATGNWSVWHKSLPTPTTQRLLLNLTNAVQTDTTYWNSTLPSSTIVTLGTAWSAFNTIMYCFSEIAGFSKAFSYTGTGNADGPYISLGFRARWFIIKQTTAASTTAWYVFDAVRNTYNTLNLFVTAESSAQELSGTAGVDYHDVTANGIKIRSSSSGFNVLNGTYIGFAFAESPFQYANAR